MSTSEKNPPELLDPAPPKIPGHHLLRCVGRGSYGEVWVALNVMKKWAAVKVVYHRAGTDRRAYDQEFRGIQRYDDVSGRHGSLMPVKDVGENLEGGFFYYAMELADDANTGQPLPRPEADSEELAQAAKIARDYQPRTLSEELRRRGRLPTEVCIEYGTALAEALQVVHQNGLVHRDVKPSNIIFVNGRPKLADVGLVTEQDATLNSLAGTPGFVPTYGAGKSSGDVYALGIVLYLAATGNTVSECPREIPDFDKLPEQERERIRELQAVYERAFDPEPEDRQPSAQVLRDELELLRRNESVLHLRQLENEREVFETRRQETRRRIKKWAMILVPGSLIFIIAAGLLAVYAWRLRTAHEATVAELQAQKLSRMLVRKSGWSERDWRQIQKAAKQNKAGGLDAAIASQAISTMSGVDASIIGSWLGVEASSAAFAEDGRVLLAGHGTNRAMLILNGTNRVELPVAGDGQACWGSDGEPLIWQATNDRCVLLEANTGNERQGFSLNPNEHVAMGNAPVLAVTPEGLLTAAGLVRSNEGRVVVWSTKEGLQLGEDRRLIRSLAFSPDGNLLAAGDGRGRTTLWKTSPFAILAELPPGKRPNPIDCLAFTEDRVVPQGTRNLSKRWLLAVGDSGAGIVVWDLTKRLPRAFCAGADYNIQSLAFANDGITLASAGRADMRLWDIMAGEELLRVDGLTGSDTPALAFDRKGNRLACGANAASSPSAVGLLELSRHRGLQRLRGLGFQVRKVWFSPDNRLIAALSDDWSLAVWEVESGALLHVFETAGELADNAGGAFDASGTKFGFAADKEAQLYDLETGLTIERWRIPHGFGEEMQFDSGGRLLLIRRQPTLENVKSWEWTLYELAVGREATVLHQQADLSYRPISMAFPAPALKFLVIIQNRATRADSLCCFNVKSGTLLWKVELHHNLTWATVQATPGGKWCGFRNMSGAGTDFVRMDDGTLAFSFPQRCLALGPDGREYVTAGGETDKWILRSTDKFQPLIEFGSDSQQLWDTFSISPNGKLIAWGTMDGSVFLAKISDVRQRLATLQR
jgi:WD40 repeat protein